MRTISLLTLTLIIFGGCKDNGSTLQPSAAVLRVDLQSQFFDDSVLVQVDGCTVFEGRVTTHNILNLAKTIPVDATSGQHHIHVQVVHPYTGTQSDTTVTLADTLTVAVTLDERSRALYFTLYPFLLPYR